MRINGPNLAVLHILQWSVVVTHFLEIIRVFSIGLQNPEPYASKLKKLGSHIITFHNLSLQTSHLRSIFFFGILKYTNITTSVWYLGDFILILEWNKRARDLTEVMLSKILEEKGKIFYQHLRNFESGRYLNNFSSTLFFD